MRWCLKAHGSTLGLTRVFDRSSYDGTRHMQAQHRTRQVPEGTWEHVRIDARL